MTTPPSTVAMIIDAIHDVFRSVGGIVAFLQYEPASSDASPLMYSLLDSAQLEYRGPQIITHYRVMHRVCIVWQDAETVEQQLLALADALPRALAANPQLDDGAGSLLNSGVARIDSMTTGFIGIEGAQVTHRTLELYTKITYKEFTDE